MGVIKRGRGRREEIFPGFFDIAEIGVGSIATVYRAREVGSGRRVALKLLNVRDVSDRALESFQREAVALGELSAHPNIVTLYRTFQTPDGRPVLVLELCTGSVAARLQGPQRLTPARVVALGVKMSAALETAHRAQILHRDVKPQNILLTEYGEPALADFGVAKLAASAQTTSGLFDFTTLHVAPELLEGRSTSPATDVYELASTLYQLLAGQSAFRSYAGESPASVILRILRDPVRPLAGDEVPPALSDLLVEAMSKDQQSRPSTAAEFAFALAGVERVEGWPTTHFLVRDTPQLVLPGSGPLPARSRAVTMGVRTSAPLAVEAIGVGGGIGRLAAGPGVPAGTVARPADVAGFAPIGAPPWVNPAQRAPAPPDPARPIASTADATGGGLSRRCERGHLVAATVTFCPICGSSALGPAPSGGPTEPEPSGPARPAHDPWNPTGAPRPDPSTGPVAAAGPATFPIPPQRPDAAIEPGSAEAPGPDPAGLARQWGAVRSAVAAGSAGTAPPSQRLVLRARPGKDVPGSASRAGLITAAWLLVGAGAIRAVMAAGGALPPALAIAIAVLVVTAAGGLALRLGVPALVVDSVGLAERGRSGAVRLGWSDVVGLEPRYRDARRGVVVAHSRTGVCELATTSGPAAGLVDLAARLDAYRGSPRVRVPR